MDEEVDRGVRAKTSDDEVDRLINLPESLLYQILLNLPTKDVVKTSELSSSWRHIWRYVPCLDLGYDHFEEYDIFVIFVDSFLGNNESCLHKFELKDNSLEGKYKWFWAEPDIDHIIQWLDTVIKRKVQHLHFLQHPWNGEEIKIPLTVYTCESLLSLKLCDVVLLNPKFVSLPSLKVMYLDEVKFAKDWGFDMLISGCPVLESLTIKKRQYDNVKVLCLCSQSLLSFTLLGHRKEEDLDEDLVVVVDAPRLEKLELVDRKTDCFMINNLGSLVKVVIDVTFNLSKRNMIRNFLLWISSVKDMVITSYSLEAIYNFSKCEPLPLFRNLSSLRADFKGYNWEILPFFLEIFPNIKSLTLAFEYSSEQPTSILTRPHCFLPSLEYVEIVKPMRNNDVAEMKLVSYFLENSMILKKFTICLGDSRRKEQSVILKKILAIPKLSSGCQVVVL